MTRIFGVVGVVVSVVLSVAEIYADPGVLIEVENETVTEFIYVGGSPNSTTVPAVKVSGKAVGLTVNANSVNGAKGIVGAVGGFNLGSFSSSKIGVLGKSPLIGVAGDATSYGVYGLGYGVGVYGTAAYYGVEGYGGHAGVYGSTSSMYGDAGYFDGDVYVDGDVYEGSDRILKENVRPLDRGLNVVMSLAPKAYERKNGVTKTKHRPGTRFGLIAQDVEVLAPELVKGMKTGPAKDANGMIVEGGDRLEFKAVNYTGMIPILIKAIQEQQSLIESLQAEIAALKN